MAANDARIAALAIAATLLAGTRHGARHSAQAPLADATMDLKGVMTIRVEHPVPEAARPGTSASQPLPFRTAGNYRKVRFWRRPSSGNAPLHVDAGKHVCNPTFQ